MSGSFIDFDEVMKGDEEETCFQTQTKLNIAPASWTQTD